MKGRGLRIHLKSMKGSYELVDVLPVHQAFPNMMHLRTRKKGSLYRPVTDFKCFHNELSNFQVENLELIFKLLKVLPESLSRRQAAMVIITIFEHYKDYKPIGADFAD